MKIILTYLATQLSEAEIEKIVTPMIKKDGAVPRQDKDISVAMKQQKGTADGKLVQEHNLSVYHDWQMHFPL